MKKFIFDKNDYKNYKDMYRDMAYKFGDYMIKDYYDTSCFDYSGDILIEFLLCTYGYKKNDIKVILKNFNIEEIKKEKNFDDYKYNIIISVFEDFVRMYPNNKLEFRDE